MSAPMPRPPSEIHHVEGVLYMPLDGRACVMDTGLEVWEIIRSWKQEGEDWRALTERYHWLTFDDLNAALTFYRLNPEMVDERIAEEFSVSVEDVWEMYPDSKPPYR